MILIVGPSIMLVHGTTEDDTHHTASKEKDRQEVMFGVYLSTPWKSSSKGMLPNFVPNL
jgi:hypothetical protein